MEKIINQNHIIDDVKKVEERLNQLVEGGVDISKMIDFINSEKQTVFYFDQYLIESSVEDRQTYLAWVDSGYCYNQEPIFISLIKYADEYCGHFIGTAKYLVNGLIKNNGRYMEYTQNLEKFRRKYDKKIEQRTTKHIENTLKNQDMGDEKMITDIGKLLNLNGYQVSEKSYEENRNQESVADDFPVQKTMTNITEEIFNSLLYPSWKSMNGLDRYIKIIGQRIGQLITEGKTEYYVMNNIRSVVVNTGLINLFGSDFLVLYRINQKQGTYVAYQIMSGKGDYLENNFTKEQASVELKPIQFAEVENLFFEATLDEFDINQRCLTHIIEERRSRFPEELQEESANKISAKLMEALQRGLKIQMRDHSYAKLIYSGKDGKLTWLLPLHVNNEFTQEPELAMAIRKGTDFYEVKTILSYDDELKDRITALSLYRHLW